MILGTMSPRKLLDVRSGALTRSLAYNNFTNFGKDMSGVIALAAVLKDSQIWPTHLSEDTLLCLRPSHSAVMPSVVNVPLPYLLRPQSWLPSKLPGTNDEQFQKCDMARCHTTTNVGQRLTSDW